MILISLFHKWAVDWRFVIAIYDKDILTASLDSRMFYLGETSLAPDGKSESLKWVLTRESWCDNCDSHGPPEGEKWIDCERRGWEWYISPPCTRTCQCILFSCSEKLIKSSSYWAIKDFIPALHSVALSAEEAQGESLLCTRIACERKWDSLKCPSIRYWLTELYPAEFVIPNTYVLDNLFEWCKLSE